MCFITTAIKLKDNERVAHSIANMMLKEQDSNNHGSGSFCFNREGDQTYEQRKMSEDLQTMKDNLKAFDIVNYHFRKSTGGELGQHNVHFWRIGNWLFSHNGTTYQFQKGKDCDSLGLFKTLIKKHLLGATTYINIQKIKKLINQTTFWGRLVIVNTQSKTVYFFGDFHSYLIDRSYVVVTSSWAKFDKKDIINSLGINYETDEGEKLEVLEAKIEGIFSFDFQNDFRLLDNKFKDFNYEKSEKEKKWEPVPSKEDKEKAEEEYCGSNEYLAELEKIEHKYSEVEKRVGTNFSEGNIKLLERAEIERDNATEALDERFFGTKSIVKLL